MMNALALGLVLTSLVTAGFFTPNPENQMKPNDDVIVKEGRRVVVVEYEKDEGNTKVSISPPDSHSFDQSEGVAAKSKEKLSEKIEDVKEGTKDVAEKSREKLSEKFEDVKEGTKDVAAKSKEKLLEKMEDVKEGTKEEIHTRFRPRELVCDAYGKCKHKIAGVIGKTKEAAAEVAEMAHEVEEGAAGVVSGAIGKVKDTAHKAFDEVEEAKESFDDSTKKAKEKVVEKATGIRDEASRRMEGAKEKAGGIGEEASRKIEGAKEKASGIREEASRKMEGAKEKASEIKEETSRRMEGAKEEASRRMEGAKEKAREAKKEGEKELSEIMHHARDVVVEVFNYVFSAETVAPLTGVLHLMGFAAAYGMCLWVTFGSSHVLAGALPRQQFAMVQSRIYPLYFKAMGNSVGMALLGHLMSPRKVLGTRGGMFRGFDLVAALALILVNLLYLEPRATKVMHERMKMEKEEGIRKDVHATEHASARAPDSTAEAAGRGSTGVVERGKRDESKSDVIQLNQTLQRLNSYSSFLNVMTLVALTWHLVRLGPRLHAVC